MEASRVKLMHVTLEQPRWKNTARLSKQWKQITQQDQKDGHEIACWMWWRYLHVARAESSWLTCLDLLWCVPTAEEIINSTGVSELSLGFWVPAKQQTNSVHIPNVNWWSSVYLGTVYDLLLQYKPSDNLRKWYYMTTDAVFWAEAISLLTGGVCKPTSEALSPSNHIIKETNPIHPPKSIWKTDMNSAPSLQCGKDAKLWQDYVLAEEWRFG